MTTWLAKEPPNTIASFFLGLNFAKTSLEAATKLTLVARENKVEDESLHLR